MMSEQTNQLVQDIFLQMRNPAAHQRVKEDPETHLLSLLKEIKKDLEGDKKYRVPLYNTVERASYGDSVSEARAEMEEPVSQE